MKANSQTYHIKSFLSHKGVVLIPQITKNKVEPVLWDTLYLGFLLHDFRHKFLAGDIIHKILRIAEIRLFITITIVAVIFWGTLCQNIVVNVTTVKKFQDVVDIDWLEFFRGFNSTF